MKSHASYKTLKTRPVPKNVSKPTQKVHSTTQGNDIKTLHESRQQAKYLKTTKNTIKQMRNRQKPIKNEISTFSNPQSLSRDKSAHFNRVL